MNQSRTTLVAAVTGLTLAVSSLSLAALQGSASANAGHQDVANDRIAAAFSAAPALHIDPALSAAAELRKGDLMFGLCAGQSWPNIAARCVSPADADLPPTRAITVGHQVGDATTILFRVPASQVAAR